MMRVGSTADLVVHASNPQICYSAIIQNLANDETLMAIAGPAATTTDAKVMPPIALHTMVNIRRVIRGMYVSSKVEDIDRWIAEH